MTTAEQHDELRHRTVLFDRNAGAVMAGDGPQVFARIATGKPYESVELGPWATTEAAIADLEAQLAAGKLDHLLKPA